jgi:hypothetical protein
VNRLLLFSWLSGVFAVIHPTSTNQSQPHVFVIVTDSIKYPEDDQEPKQIAEYIARQAQLSGANAEVAALKNADRRCKAIHKKATDPTCDVAIFVQEQDPDNKSKIKMIVVFREPYQNGHDTMRRPVPARRPCTFSTSGKSWERCRETEGTSLRDRFKIHLGEVRHGQQ